MSHVISAPKECPKAIREKNTQLPECIDALMPILLLIPMQLRPPGRFGGVAYGVDITVNGFSE